MLPHAIYFDTLASITDESSQEWKTTTAGLVVLRLVDDWLEFGPHIVSTDVTGLSAVRAAIQKVSDGDPVRTLLERVVTALEEAETASILELTPTLLAYAQALQYAELPALQADVFGTLHKYSTAADDIPTVIVASLRLGILARNEGKFELAEQYHSAAKEHAYAIGDVGSSLLARLGHAKTTAMRGNVGQADTLCAEIVADAAQSGLTEIHGLALHDRAYMAYLRHDYQSFVSFGHQALEYVQTLHQRDRILVDIALGFVKLGHSAAARDANLILVSTAQELAVRWNATINLMHLAATERQEETFELYRAALACVTLSPRSDIYYRWAVGYGLRIFGDAVQAQKELQQALDLAEQYQMQQLVFELEEELKKQPVCEWSSEIDSIADAIGEELQFRTVSVV